MVTADDAWAALSKALEEEVPLCEGDDLFTADRLAPEDAAFCLALCAACPVLAECRAYATAARPASGYWAGRQYGKQTGRKSRAKARAPAEA